VFQLEYYNSTGTRRHQAEPALVLDLSPGSLVEVSHPDASNFAAVFQVSSLCDAEGNWMVETNRPGQLAIQRRLGRWFITAAMRGELECVPVINKT
jgi:hypothetical protein